MYQAAWQKETCNQISSSTIWKMTLLNSYSTYDLEKDHFSCSAHLNSQVLIHGLRSSMQTESKVSVRDHKTHRWLDVGVLSDWKRAMG